MAKSMFEIDNRASDWRKLQEGSDFATRINHAPSFAQQVKDFAVQAGFETADLEGDKYSVAFHELEEVGYSQPMHLMDRGAASEIVSYFKARPCYNAHVLNQSDGVGRRVGDDADRHPFGSYSLSDIIAAPGLLELANDPFFLGASERYLGCVPTLYSMNTWWSFPTDFEGLNMTQAFHRDFDDFKYFSLFICLNDMTENRGPTQYVAGTHTWDKFNAILMAAVAPGIEPVEVARMPTFERLVKLLTEGACYVGDDKILDLFGKQLETICADAGTGFIVNPSGFHRARPPIDGSRLMFWARYGLYPNLATRWDKVKPVTHVGIENRIETNLKSRYINRLLIDFPPG